MAFQSYNSLYKAGVDYGNNALNGLKSLDFSANLGSNLSNATLGLDAYKQGLNSVLNNTTQTSAQQVTQNATGELVGNIGAGVTAVASLFNSVNGFMTSRGQLKEMKKQNNLLRQQWETEKSRYNEEKKIRDEANSEINASAKYFDLPMERN